ncbi:MAG: LysM peptidoglycan-binding domain-containing protein [Kiritimatiellaeota bacterium]|nr:LysM peptidoglycan-binding domain-containing protein [Kiritimatiellota bacterium]
MKGRNGPGLLLIGVTGCAAVLALSGCTSFRNWTAKKRAERGVLLAPRTIVPPPYSEPPPAASTEAPVEPTLPAPPTPAVSEQEPVSAETIKLPPPVETEPLTHKVAKGESFWKIAVMYGVSQDELAAYNKMSLKDVLPAGKVLKIPPGGHFIPPEQRPKFKPQRRKKAAKSKTGKTGSVRGPRQPLPASGKYTVKSGDSLWKIAHRYGLKTGDIRRANDLKSDLLQIGQVLVLPQPAGTPGMAGTTAGAAATTGTAAEGTAAAAAPAAATTIAPKTAPKEVVEYPKKLEHEVAAGETLQGLADMYGVKVEDIKKANPQIRSDADLKPKSLLIIPYP